jgi:hypothetical protein
MILLIPQEDVQSVCFVFFNNLVEKVENVRNIYYNIKYDNYFEKIPLIQRLYPASTEALPVIPSAPLEPSAPMMPEYDYLNQPAYQQYNVQQPVYQPLYPDLAKYQQQPVNPYYYGNQPAAPQAYNPNPAPQYYHY